MSGMDRLTDEPATASSDRLREAVALLMETPFEPSLAFHVQLVCEAIGRKLDADAAGLSEYPVQGEKS